MGSGPWFGAYTENRKPSLAPTGATFSGPNRSMLVIVGYVIILVAVIGGFILSGGHLKALIQPTELLSIGGGAVGAFLVGNSKQSLKATLAGIKMAFKPIAQTKESYIDILLLLYALLSKVRKEGVMSIERDVEDPHASTVFQDYPTILGNHHLTNFITDYLRMMVGGNLNPFEIETLMEAEIEIHHHEALVPSHAIAKLADALPAFGIVAAVMGVVHTMESVGAAPAVLGGLIAAALVGTFLGILLAYGFVGPLAGVLEQHVEAETQEYQCIRAVLIASMGGYAPPVAIEFGRKLVPPSARPDFPELEEAIRQAKAAR